MSYTNFDCTQLLTFQTDDLNCKRTIKAQFEQMGFIVSADGQISPNKLKYFKEYLNDLVIELEDKEFIGEFEDWKDVDDLPDRIELFIMKLNNILNKSKIQELKLFIVSDASDNINEDDVTHVSSSLQNFKKTLFLMSAWNFDVKTSVLIINVYRDFDQI
ncbi:hypothetical protein [Fictibacillus sp. 18YEL24]|uniref:hypothetical protein n=1 Tax=Fictibacillus sp. 18YEL24 TaxID=2745875 RepID=UPI0018CEFE58|nr:hypothetical protein [Fictibacillus sp. 18YEL24]MBH0171446.1 hypothetical protein [Fictibacillus sp. 18YEL24]